MTRLTNAIRLDVATRILHKTFKDRFTEIETERNELALELRKSYLGRYLEAYEKLPKHLQQRSKGIRVNCKGTSYYNRADYYWKNQVRMTIHDVRGIPSMHIGLDPSTKDLPSGCDNYAMIDMAQLKDSLKKRVEKHELKFDLLKDDVKKLHRKITEQLSVCTTVKKLNDLWPEAVTFAPKGDNPIAVVVDREGVNNMIACMAKGDCK